MSPFASIIRRRVRAAAALAALLPAPARAADSDGAAALASMKQAASKLRALHAVVRCEQREGDSKSTRFVECWIDVRGGRVRTELRDAGRASPRLAIVAGPERMRLHQLEWDEIAEQRRAFDLATALAASFAGELLATAFRGDLVTFKAAAYGKPRLAPAGELVDGVGCTRLVFDGNETADLWIGDRDRLPRRIRGPLGRAQLEETLDRLDLDPKLDDVDFEMAVPEGRRLPEPAEVRRRWSEPPAEEEGWPQPLEDAPDFAAVDLEARARMLSETGEERAILAFWTPEDPASVQAAAAAEQAWRAAGSRPRFVHVAAGGERDPVARAAAAHRLQAEIWVAGTHPQNAFRRWRIWRCPVFVQLDDLQVVAIARDPDAAGRWDG